MWIHAAGRILAMAFGMRSRGADVISSVCSELAECAKRAEHAAAVKDQRSAHIPFIETLGQKQARRGGKLRM